MNPLEDLRAAMSRAGIPFAGQFVINDQFQHFDVQGEKGKSSYYSGHNIGEILLVNFGCFRRDLHQTWTSHNRNSLTHDQQIEFSRSIKDLEAKRQAEIKAGEAAAREKCSRYFSTFPKATPAHPYLTRKGVPAIGDVRLFRGELYEGWLTLPLKDGAGTIHTAQFISDDGQKKYSYMGRKRGCFFELSSVPGGPVLICEGYATGASLSLATGWTVICAMDCGNLLPVAQEILKLHPDRTLLIAADNDQFTEGNPGLTHAQHAARAAKTLIALPEFADESLSEKPTDFNDLHRLAGLREVKRQIHQSFPILKLLSDREWNPNARPPESVPVLSLKEITIATPSNISTITAAVKSGKSAGIEAMAASTFSAPDSDTLGFKSSNPEGKALLHFDSEQSPEDHWYHVDRIIRRAQAPSPPKWLKSYCLTGLSFKQCQDCVWEAMRLASEEFPGILAVLIDGYCDLVSDVNDPKEANDLVARLHGLAIQYACHISGVIHLNPGTEKSRGHLGSQLERKSETNLQMEKDTNDESSLIFSTKNRRAGIPRNLGIAFKWDDDLKMHLSHERAPSLKSGAPSIVSRITSLNLITFTSGCPTAGEARKEIARRLESWLATQSIDASFDTCRRAIVALVANGKLLKGPSSGLYFKGTTD